MAGENKESMLDMVLKQMKAENRVRMFRDKLLLACMPVRIPGHRSKSSTVQRWCPDCPPVSMIGEI